MNNKLKECNTSWCDTCIRYIPCNTEKLISNSESRIFLREFWLDSYNRIYTKTKLENEIFKILKYHE